MIRFSIPALALGAALFSIQPADACHRFHVWKYPFPQRCSTNTPDFAPGARVRRPLSRDIPSADPHSYYVEIVEQDTRTPDQISDYDEHNFAVLQHHEDINRMMIILHAEEDAAKAAGLKQ